MKTEHYQSLDALRGVAAILVAFCHMNTYAPVNLPSAYLAVDFFFLLSGFVLMHAYGDRLAAGWGAWPFMRVRLVRLYPLYMVGAVLAIVVFAVASKVAPGPGDPTSAMAWIKAGVALLLVPDPRPGSELFLNTPAWSLWFELLANLVFVACYAVLTRKVLIAVVVASLAGLIAMVVATGAVSHTVDELNIAHGVLRTSFSFFLGVLLFGVRDVARYGERIPAAVPVVALIIALTVQFDVGWYQLLFVCVIGPAILLTAANFKAFPAYRFLGDMSYSLYILHIPVQRGARAVADVLNMPQYPFAVVATLALIAATPLISRFVDRPLREVVRRILPARIGTAPTREMEAGGQA